MWNFLEYKAGGRPHKVKARFLSVIARKGWGVTYARMFWPFFHQVKVPKGRHPKKCFLNRHCPDRSESPLPYWATGNVVLSFGRQKRQLRIKFQLKMMMKMVMIMVIILMLDDNYAQKSSTSMTLWSKYTPFKYYYLVKHRKNCECCPVSQLIVR